MSPAEARAQLLLVDDDAELCAMLREYLEPEGFGAETAENGQSALERLARGGIDLVVLDVMLPGLSGFEVLRRLRADARTREIPVVAVSANAMPDDLAQARAAGFADYLTKPLDLSLLLTTVDRMLGALAA